MSALSERILLVGDERAVLEALCRQHRKRYALIPAYGAGAGLKAITEQGPEELISLGAASQPALGPLRAEGRKYDRRVLDTLATAEALTDRKDVRLVLRSQPRVGTILEEKVRNTKGNLLVTRGHKISEASLQRLRNYAALKLLTKTEFRVRMPKCTESASAMSAV